MATTMQTLKDIAAASAKKQPGMVDALLEESPILSVCRWAPASHNLWNVAEEMVDVDGPGFVEMNAVLPMMEVSTNLRRVDLSIMGGLMQVPQDKAEQYGGPQKYFSRKQDKLLKKAGCDTEVHLYYKNWLAFARDNKKLKNAGASTAGCRSLLVVRFDEDGNTGLYDAGQFDRGTLLRVMPMNNGALHALQHEPYKGVPGFAVMLKGRFGWQVLDARCVAGVVNIQPGKLPTASQIDDAVSEVRGKPENTFIFCHAKTKNLCLNPEKHSAVRAVDNRQIDRTVDTWNGIPIVESYNLLDGTEEAYSLL